MNRLQFNPLSYTVIIVITLISACNSAEKWQAGDDIQEDKLSIFAAAGTRIITDEICDSFEGQTDFTVARNYASSGVLARQIAQGAEADVFVSANLDWIQYLIDEGKVDPDSVRKIASTSLVVIAPFGFEIVAPQFNRDFDILASAKEKIAIGDPDYVPVGMYTKMVFDSLGWYDLLADKLILAKDVSSVLHFVEMGSCDWGIVYCTEALQSTKVKVISKVPSELHSPIYFYVASIQGAKAGSIDLDHLFEGKEMQEICEKHGFNFIE